MESAIAIEKAEPDATVAPEDAAMGASARSRALAARGRLQNAMSAAKRVRFRFSRLTAAIVIMNMVALTILLVGALWLGQVREGFIRAKMEALRGQGQLIAEVLARTAIQEDAPRQYLDEEIAREVLARILNDISERVILYDSDGVFVVDSRQLNDEIEIAPLPDAIDPDSGPPSSRQTFDRDFWRRAAESLKFDAVLQPGWIDEAHEATIGEEIERALDGETVEALRFGQDGQLIVSVSTPIRPVQTVFGVVTLEARDIDDLIADARAAVLPFFVIAVGVSLALSIALTALIANPIRRLARAADQIRDGVTVAARRDIPVFPGRRDEIGELAKALAAMTDALFDRLEAIEHFAADVSHEIKNPLTSIKSAIETLPRVSDPEKRDRLLAVIKKDVERMDRLITDISNASRLDAELAREQRGPIEIGSYLQDIVEGYAQLQRENGARIVFERPFHAEYFVNAQPSALGQVFRNLLDNARSFSPPDGEVRVSIDADQNEVRIRIDDQGPGIPPENLESIFRRFYTERPAGTEFGNNSGLGLSISKQIVESYGGRIWGENRLADPADPESPRRGARFVVALPRI